MSRRGFTSSAAASPHAVEVPDRGEGLTTEAAQLAHLNRSPDGAYDQGELADARQVVPLGVEDV